MENSNGHMNRLSRKLFYRMFIYQIAVLALFIIVFCSNTYLNKRSTAKQVSEIISTFIINEQNREVINSLSSMTKDSFSAVAFIDEHNELVVSIPPKQSGNHPLNKGIISSVFTSNFAVDILPRDGGNKKKGKLVFSFNIFDTVYLSLIVWGAFTLLLIPVIRRYKKLLDVEFEKSALHRERSAIGQMIKEVWHDIGQPLQVLSALQENSKTMCINDKNKIMTSCEDITQIVEQLKGVEDTTMEYQLLPLIKSIIETEKVKYQSLGVNFKYDFSEDAIGFFVKMQKLSFKRIIANIVDNSVKAFDKDLKDITIKLASRNNLILLSVEDNGVGIEKSNLPYVGMKGRSYRKDGNGIGISSAIAKLSTWGGNLKIESNHLIGTEVIIELPKQSLPVWASSKINYKQFKQIIVLDDRKPIYDLIRSNITTGGIKDSKIKYFNELSTLKSWLTENDIDKTKVFFICDYDLGPRSPSGISIIKLLEINNNSVLLTNHYEDRDIQEECTSSGIKLAPKILISEIFSS